MKNNGDRLFEVFKHVTGVRMFRNEGDLEYFHVDNAEPTTNNQVSSIGSEIAENNEFPINVVEAKKLAADKKDKAIWDKHKAKIDRENAKMPEPIKNVMNKN